MRRISPLVPLVLLVAACGDSAAPAVDAAGTFAQLQTRVFNASCTSCHRAGQAEARQSGLILTAGQSYSALVNAPAQNANARADGLARVQPGDPERSLLYHKLHGAADHHSRDYGNPMPTGTTLLSQGQLEFVRKWIEAGAPSAGFVADSALLSDRTPQPLTTFAAPPRPARGYQLRIEPFTVQPAFEREIFVYKAVGNPQTEYVTRIETRMRPGSHHLLVQTFRDNTPGLFMPQLNVVRDIRLPNGQLDVIAMAPMAFHVFFAGSMTPSSDYALPPGVALRLPAQARLDLNSHYVNRGVAGITGEAYVNLHTTDSAQIRNVASTLDWGNTDLTLPPNMRTTVTRTFTAASVMRILMLTSHMHERGEKFEIRIRGGARDGELVYSTTDWAHPAIVTYQTPIVLQPGEGLTSIVTYNNTTSRTIRFGLTSQDEMNIIFGYWY